MMGDELKEAAKAAINGTESVKNCEPSEADPCIEDKTKRKAEVFLRFREGVCKKTGLNHDGFGYVSGVVVAVVVLLIVVIALAAAWPRIPHSYRFPVCKESACLRASAQVREGLNPSESACSNLWGWACGGWFEKNPLPKDRSVWNQKELLIRTQNEKIRDLIGTLNLPLKFGTVEWKMYYLYSGCTNVLNINSEKAGPLKKIINDLGGWYGWSDDFDLATFDYRAVLRTLQVKYGVSPFFKISVQPSTTEPGANIVTVSPSGLGMPSKKYYFYDEDDRFEKAYKEFIRDILLYMGKTRDEAAKLATNIFSYEKRIAEVTPDVQYLQNPISTGTVYSISEIKGTVDVLGSFFHDILSAMYPEANITEITEIKVVSLPYLHEISSIISSSDKQTLNLYIMWTLVRTYLPYLSEEYSSAIDNFNKALLGKTESLQRWEVCTNLLKEFMGVGIEGLMEKREPISFETLRVVNETFNSLIEVAKKRLAKFKDSSMLYKQIKQKLLNVKLQVGVPEKLRDLNNLKFYYNRLTVLKAVFFDSVKNAIIFQRSLEEAKLKSSKAGELLVAEHMKVTYIPSENVIVVPSSLLSKPYFESEYPRAVVYSRLGVEIAEAIAAAMLPYGNLWTADHKLLTSYHISTNESISSVRSATKCLSNYLMNLHLNLPYKDSNETALNALKQLLAVSLSHEAFIEKISKMPHIHQSGLEEFEDSALFFTTFAQTQCTELTDHHRLFENLVNLNLPQKTMIHLAWSQIEEFSESLDCSFDKKLRCRDII